MKKLTAIFLSIVLFVLFLTPVSAATTDISSKNDYYQRLSDIENQLFSSDKILASLRFDELSRKSKLHLSSELNIDTAKAGKVLYTLDNDDILTVKIVSADENNLKVESIECYGTNQDGVFGKVNNTELLNEVRSMSWSNNYWYEEYTVTSTVFLHVQVYYEYYYKNLQTLYVRPYSAHVKCRNTDANDRVMNMSINVSTRGMYCDFNENVYNETVWTCTFNYSSPLNNYYYSVYNQMPDNRCLKFTNGLHGTYYDGYITTENYGRKYIQSYISYV